MDHETGTRESSSGADPAPRSAPDPDVLDRESFRAIVQAAPDGILVVAPSGVITYVNPMLTTLFGYRPDELVGHSVEVLLPAELRAAHVTHRRGWAAEPQNRPMASGLDLRGLRKDGTEFPVEISLSPLPGAHGSALAIVRDVTERRRAADELMHAHEQLALVDDRERIARDLHDTVIQRLFAIGLSLQGALARAADQDLATRIETAIDEIDGTIRDVRTAIFALHAERTPTAGARDEVLATTREAARALGFEPHVRFDGPIDATLPDAVHEHLIPTLREALTNVAKHARATRVTIELRVADDVCLRVTDNGIGIVDAATGGQGLANMVDRARTLGGTCTVDTPAEGGTTIVWRVPVRTNS